MKIILDNIIYSHLKQGGISNYWFELSKFLMQDTAEGVIFYEEKNALSNFHRKQLHIPNNQLINNISSFNSSIKARLSKVKAPSDDYFLFHSSYYRPLVGSKNYDEVTTVHDFTHNYYSSLLKRVIHNKVKYSAIRRSKGVICISESTYNDLKKFCPTGKNQKIEIIHNGVSDEYHLIDKAMEATSRQYLQSLKIDKPYILYVGSRVNYKNFDFVAQLLNQQKDLQLVIIGGALNPSELKLFDKEAIKRLIVIGNVSNSDLNILYNYAHALIYPSSYEGFGIPIIEAMKAGCPVLTLKNSSIIEVSGNATLMEDTLDLNAFKDGLQKLGQQDFRADIIGKGLEQSSKFSWNKCCRETHAFYQELYRG